MDDNAGSGGDERVGVGLICGEKGADEVLDLMDFVAEDGEIEMEGLDVGEGVEGRHGRRGEEVFVHGWIDKE